ncbi:uncharacterized protein LOC120426074 [Culex pipiens pallens]|uniref:uncharacterized protein LOC120426074 n=1 Tax=Culex pipiens pallens TaxID=42434 RepID=UPI00195483CA|nr:uncharacterized protein LOC120426074 [Culex pipiens pallens]
MTEINPQISSTATMELLTTVPLILLTIQQILATSSTDAQDYVLRAIEYLVSVKPGVFSCVFYDVTQRSFDNDFNVILESPRLGNVVKYVINGTYHEGLAKLEPEPSLLILHPGNDSDHFEANMKHVQDFLRLFKPTTKVLVLIDSYNEVLVGKIYFAIHTVKYTYSAYVERLGMLAYFCNGVNCWRWPRVPQPMYLFSYGRRWIQGRNISYIGEEYFCFAWNRRWLNEVTRYLGTDSAELQHNCKGLGSKFYECLHNNTEVRYDIIFNTAWIVPHDIKNYLVLCTSRPIFMRLLVPKDRPLNAVELMLMPFSGPAWCLILAILLLIEIVKHLFPKHFTNDPFLLAVCGFERHDLHRAGRWEKTVFLALIILMFFMTNAFETKIVSLMTSKPSIQRIKTLTDLFQSDVKFRYDLENSPHLQDFLFFGELIIHGETPDLSETVPGIGTMCFSEWCELLEEISFDFERMQPFYVLLDYETLEYPECYATDYRFIFAETFRTMHSTLTEAGLFILWKRQWRAELRSNYIGRRPREDARKNSYLSFDDMQPAWIALRVGMGISLFAFLGEYSTRWSLKNIRKCLQKYKRKWSRLEVGARTK